MRIIPPIGTVLQAITGKYKVQGNPDDADCVIGFSFAYRGTQTVSQGLKSQAAKGGQKHEQSVQPGLSNEDLANVIEKHFARLPKILQFEIADAYTADEAPNADTIVRIERHRTLGLYLDTREVADQAKAIMRKNGWKKAVIVAHPYHMPRVYAVCKRLGINCVATRDEYGAVEFDLKSSQKWTRSTARWWQYEPLVVIFYWLKGWL